MLEKINNLEDFKKIDTKDYPKLASEIREFLIDNVSKTGGHLAPNLGVVELTMALHHVFNSPDDKIIFDVGHQCYVHKILTGRKDKFDALRKLDGLSGFPKTYGKRIISYFLKVFEVPRNFFQKVSWLPEAKKEATPCTYILEMK